MSVLLYSVPPYTDSRTNNTGMVADMAPDKGYERYTPPFASPVLGFQFYHTDMAYLPEGLRYNYPVVPVYLQDMHFNQMNQVLQANWRFVDLGLRTPEVQG